MFKVAAFGLGGTKNIKIKRIDGSLRLRHPVKVP